MKKVIHVLLLVILFGCVDTDSNKPFSEFEETITEVGDSDSSSNDDSQSTQGVEVTLNVSLPESSVVSEEDLLVSSLLTVDASIVEGVSFVNVFEGDGFEISFAEDSSGNIVLINYFKPIINSGIDLNSTTTATSMIMLQPWVTDLSIEARGELIGALDSYPEFQSLIQAIESSLTSDGNPLGNTEVISSMNALFDKLLSDPNPTGKVDPYVYPQEPITLIGFDEGTLKLENTSSLGYGVKLNNGQRSLLEGVDKTLFTITGGVIYELATGSNVLKDSIIFNNITNDGSYLINANNGLADLETENIEARAYNAGRIALSLIGLATSGVIDASNKSCAIEVGNFLRQEGVTITNASSSEDLVQSILKPLRKQQTYQ